MSNLVPFSNYLEVNPARYIPDGLNLASKVSFVPMADVSESGHWFGSQVRRLNEVTSGFTNFKNNDVLVAKITPCFENGKGAFVADLKNGVGFGSTEFHVLRAKEGVCARFIFHVTQWPNFRLSSERFMTGSAGQKRVQALAFSQFEMGDFEEGEQKTIANILDTLDTQIRQTEAIIAKLQQVKQGLLHDLLTRGIDESGQLRPSYEQAPELYKESPLGWIPQAWNVASLSDCTLKIADRDHTTPNYVESGVIIISPVNFFGDEGINFDGAKKITRGAHEINLKKTDLKAGDLLLHRIGAGLGRVRLVTSEMPEFSILHSMAQLRSNPKEMDSSYLLWVMRSEPTKNQMGLGTQSIGVPDLGLEKIGRFLVPKPCINEQCMIAIQMSALQGKTNAHIYELLKLKKQKAGLMDDLLTGRVRVTELIEQEQQAS